jgi:hypothetical protein
MLGMGFASGWTPCIGVTLSAVLSSAVSAGTTGQGLVLMIAYCLGLGLPFIALAFALEKARPLVRLVNSHRRAIDLASAAVLLVMGLLLLTNNLTILASGLTLLVPSGRSPALKSYPAGLVIPCRRRWPETAVSHSRMAVQAGSRCIHRSPAAS